MNVVVAQRAAGLKLLAREEQALLVWRDTLLVLNLLLHVAHGVRQRDIKRDRLARQCLNEDLEWVLHEHVSNSPCEDPAAPPNHEAAERGAASP